MPLSTCAEAEQKVATTLEELRAQHQKELMVLQLQHQKALQEQERKLLEQQQQQVWPLTHFFLFTFCEKSLI